MLWPLVQAYQESSKEKRRAQIAQGFLIDNFIPGLVLIIVINLSASEFVGVMAFNSTNSLPIGKMNYSVSHVVLFICSSFC